MGSGNKNFKVGDWVIELCPDVDDYCKPKPSGKPKQIKKIKQGNTGLLYRLASDNYKRWLRQQDIIHWQPKVGEATEYIDPNIGREYYSVGVLQESAIEGWIFTDDIYDKRRKTLGLFFWTREEAEDYLAYMLKYIKENKLK